MAPADSQHRNSGFSLIQVSILLTVASLVLVATLPGYQTKLNSSKNSANKMNAVMMALRDFELANGRLPCPADASVAIGATGFGLENSGNGSISNCVTGTPAGIFYKDLNTAVGMVPVRTLGLTNDAALDDYGHYIDYAVDTNATSCWASAGQPSFTLTTPAQQIIVDDNGVVHTTLAALISHGSSGFGGYLPSGSSNRLNSGNTDHDKWLNAHVVSNTSFSAMTSSQATDENSNTASFVKKAPASIGPTAIFDDIVVYGNNMWNVNAIPVSLTTADTLSAVPASGTYSNSSASPWNTLTFTLTLPQPVTVTFPSGYPPRLAISAIVNSANPKAAVGSTWTGGGPFKGQSIGWATYTGTSGTTSNTLTFSYTVAAGDSAPIGITVNSPVDMDVSSPNAASILPCLTFFVPQSLSSVIINPVYIYIADQLNTRVVAYSMATGAYVRQWAATGIYDPASITMDSLGNFWVGGNQTSGYDVAKINSSTGAITLYCAENSTSGTPAAGKCYGADGLAFDTDTSHIWVASAGNNGHGGPGYLQWCLSTAANWATGSNCKLATPSSTTLSINVGSLAVDANDIVWVPDGAHGEIRAFYSFNNTSHGGTEITGGGLPIVVDGASGYPQAVAFDPASLTTASASMWVTEPNPSNPIYGTVKNYTITYSISGSGNTATITPSVVAGSSNNKNLVSANQPFGIAVAKSGSTNYAWVVDNLGGPNSLLYQCPVSLSSCTVFNSNTGDPVSTGMSGPWGIYIPTAGR